ncbi:MAG TPA: hypothetical protein VLQ66_01400 [Paenisporosarcina sp.]|nr:hypothetical protein [Paenisporosarcina sp.]
MKMKPVLFALLVFSLLWLSGCTNGQVNAGVDVNTGSEIEFPPTISGAIKIDDTKHELKAGGFRWERKQGSDTQTIQTDAASPYQIAENFKAIAIEPNQKITIDIEKNPQLVVYLWNNNEIEKEIKLNEHQITAPASTGRYIYEVVATWPNGEVSYTFVVEVK